MIATGLFFAMIQAIVHDVIPTVQTLKDMPLEMSHMDHEVSEGIGDLFSETEIKEDPDPFYKSKKFLFALKFTHIHIFGMSLLFMIVSAFVVFFDINPKLRNGLIILPFVGILIDLAAVWLKAFVSPYFFYLHLPGGALFVSVFLVDLIIAYKQMWLKN
jgi:hypothetical protein